MGIIIKNTRRVDIMKKYYEGEISIDNAVCCECGEVHYWNEEDCEVYNGMFLCSKCFKEEYGYCNECGTLNKYIDMDENIVCKECL